jgi:hypothetical protein
VPAIASLLIIAITLTSFTPAFADLPATLAAQLTLRVRTIAEDDELRQTGIMWMGTSLDDQLQIDDQLLVINDLLAQFKILISYNGAPVTPTAVICQVVEKDKYNPIKTQQFLAENLVTVPKDVSASFACKERWGKPGVGVLDVYYIGPGDPVNIADYVLEVSAILTVGRNTVYGAEIQDICILGWPFQIIVIVEDGSVRVIVPDALGTYQSCEDAALFQRQELYGIPIPWT